MLTAFKKIQKEKGAEPTEFEESVGQVGFGFMFLNVVLFNENSQANLLSIFLLSRLFLISRTPTMS